MRITLWLVVVLSAGLLWTLAGGAAGAAEPPAVAYVDGDRVAVATRSGALLGDVALRPVFSLHGSMLAVGRRDQTVVVHDARGGGRRFAISSAVHPTALGHGRVAFWGTFERDRQANSVWLRERGGRIRKIVQFSNGGDLPGYDAGFAGDNVVLSTSFDVAGQTLAVAEGNDVSLFWYDVFTVDVASGKVTRITGNRESRFPAMAPDGERVVYQRDVRACDEPYIRASNLLVETTRGTGRQALTTGADCDRWFANARWVSDHEVVAYRTSRGPGGALGTDLVLIDVDSGERRRLTATFDVSLFSADPVNGRVAYERTDTPGFTILEVATGARRHVPAGGYAHLAFDHTTM